MQINRRFFIKGIVGGVALALHPKIFDMGKNLIWTPPPPQIIPAEMGEWIDLGSIIDRDVASVLAMYGEKIADQFFTPSPTFEALTVGELNDWRSKQRILSSAR